MACVLFPNQRERRIAIRKVISLMESPILRWDQNSIQKPVLEMQERHTAYHKIQEMVPLQDKIKEDKRIRIKDSNKEKVNYQSMLIGNRSSLAPSEAPRANSACDNHHKASKSTSTHVDAFILSYKTCYTNFAHMLV